MTLDREQQLMVDSGLWVEVCAECGREADDFWHTCRFTDCRTPHPFCQYVPVIEPTDFTEVGEPVFDWPEGIWQ